MTIRKSILFICYYDSSMKISAPLIARFAADENFSVKVFFLHEREECLERQAGQFGITIPIIWGSIQDLEQANFYNVDVVHLVVPGHITRFICSSIYTLCRSEPGKRPLVVIGLVGLLAGKEYDCYYSRQWSDLIYVGSERDREALARVSRAFGHSVEKIINSGLPIYDEPSKLRKTLTPLSRCEKKIVFAGQPTFPATYVERLYIVNRLIDLADHFPSYKIVLKPRHRLTEKTFHRDQWHFETTLEDVLRSRPKPPNFVLNYSPITEHLLDTDLFLTISSTVALEALCAGRDVGILADFGVTEAYGNHFFVGSNLLLTFDDLIQGTWPKVDNSWLMQSVNLDGMCTEIVYEKIGELLKKDRMILQEPAYLKCRSSFFNFKEEFSAKKSSIPVECRTFSLKYTFRRIDNLLFSRLAPQIFRFINRSPKGRLAMERILQRLLSSYKRSTR